jgi:hypothetical protein
VHAFGYTCGRHFGCRLRATIVASLYRYGNDGAVERPCGLTGGLDREFSIPVGRLCRESHRLHASASPPNETDPLSASCFS